MTAHLVGAVLCGGASRRMGTDKSLLEVDGVPMAQRVAATLRRAGCTEVIAVGGSPALVALGLDVVADGWPGEGPLGGTVTALRAHPAATAVVVVACDLPWLTAPTIRALVAALESAGADVAAAIAVADRRQPSCAVWRPSALPAVAALFDSGERRLRAAFEPLRVVEVAVDDHDLRNVNTPSDLTGSL